MLYTGHRTIRGLHLKRPSQLAMALPVHATSFLNEHENQAGAFPKQGTSKAEKWFLEIDVVSRLR